MPFPVTSERALNLSRSDNLTRYELTNEGDVLYYGPTSEVSSSNKEGEVANGAAVTLERNVWLKSAGRSLVQLTELDSQASQTELEELGIKSVTQFGAEGNGTTDDTSAWVAAFKWLEATRGKLTIPAGKYPVEAGKLKLLCGGCAIEGDVNGGSTIVAKAGSEGHLIDFSMEASKSFVEENHACGNRIANITLDGNGRTVEASGLHLERQQWFVADNVKCANFKRQGFFQETSVRESTFIDVHTRFCGSPGSSGYSAAFIKDEGSIAEGANNNHYYNFKSVYHCGHGLRIQGKTGSKGPTRSLFFYGVMLHGAPFVPENFPWTTQEGYVYTEAGNMAEFRRGGHNLLIEDSRSTKFFGVRCNATARGFAAIRVAQGPAGSSSVNEIDFMGPTIGSPNNWAELVVTANASTDILTGSEALYLGTGAVVRVTSSGSLPTGLSASTDYWVIRQSDNEVKLATTRANAEAGTAIDLTGAGSGEIKLVPRSQAVDHEWGTVYLEKNPGYDSSKDGLSLVENRTENTEALRFIEGYGLLRGTQTASGNVVFAARLEGESKDRWQIRGDGSNWIGSGSAELEKGWYRNAENAWRLDRTATFGGGCNIVGTLAPGGNIAHTGTKVGFFSKTAAARPNVKAPSEVTAKELCEALETLGLVE